MNVSNNLKYTNNSNINNNSINNVNKNIIQSQSQTQHSNLAQPLSSNNKGGGSGISMAKQSVKINSKFSASQPFLPAYEHHHHHKPSESNGFIDQVGKIKIDANNDNHHQLLNSASGAKHLLSQVNWSNRVYTLKEIIDAQHPKLHQSFADSDALKLPLIAKIVKGTYGVIKEKSATSLLSKSSVHNLCLYQKCKFTNVLCQSIRYKDKKSILYGNKISIPLTYSGWFEVLSEDGKSVKPLYSIKEILIHSNNASNVKKILNGKQSPLPPVYLVRENITAYTITSAKLSADSLQMNEPNSKNYSNNDSSYLSANLNECKKVIL